MRIFALIAAVLAVCANAKTLTYCTSKGNNATCTRDIKILPASNLGSTMGLSWLTGYLAVVTSVTKTSNTSFTYTRQWINLAVTPVPRVTVRKASGSFSLTDSVNASSANLDFNSTTITVTMPAVFLWKDANSNGVLDAGEQNQTVPLMSPNPVTWGSMSYSNSTDANGTDIHVFSITGQIAVSGVKLGNVTFSFTLPSDLTWKNGVALYPGTVKIDKTFTPSALIKAVNPTSSVGVILALFASTDAGVLNVNSRSAANASSATGSVSVTPNVDLTFSSGEVGLLNYETTVTPYLGGVAQATGAVSMIELNESTVNTSFNVSVNANSASVSGSVSKKIYAFGFNAQMKDFDYLVWDPQTGYADSASSTTTSTSAPTSKAASHYIVSFSAIAVVLLSLTLIKRM